MFLGLHIFRGGSVFNPIFSFDVVLVGDRKSDPAKLKFGVSLEELLPVIDAGDDVQVGRVAGEEVPPSVQLSKG
jgi:hypothetical protein